MVAAYRNVGATLLCILQFTGVHNIVSYAIFALTYTTHLLYLLLFFLRNEVSLLKFVFSLESDMPMRLLQCVSSMV